MRSRKVTVIIYLSGTREERDRQFAWCYEMCERRRYSVYGVSRDDGDGTGLVDAQILKRSGIVDKIVVFSGDLLPQPDVETATGEIPKMPTDPRHRPARFARIRRVKRSGDAGA